MLAISGSSTNQMLSPPAMMELGSSEPPENKKSYSACTLPQFSVPCLPTSSAYATSTPALSLPQKQRLKRHQRKLMKKPQQRRKTELEIPNKNPLLSFQKSLNCDEKYRALPQYYLRTLKLNFVSKTKILSLILFYFFFNSEKKL